MMNTYDQGNLQGPSLMQPNNNIKIGRNDLKESNSGKGIPPMLSSRLQDHLPNTLQNNLNTKTIQSHVAGPFRSVSEMHLKPNFQSVLQKSRINGINVNQYGEFDTSQDLSTQRTLNNNNSLTSINMPLKQAFKRSSTVKTKALTHLRDRMGNPNPNAVQRLIINQNPPSIPYKDSAYGYQPIDREGKLLVNVGNSYKQSYNSQIDSSPGPGAYDIAKSYMQNSNSRSKVLGYKNDTSRRSDIMGHKKVSPRLGPGTYNLISDRDTQKSTSGISTNESQMISRKLPLLEHRIRYQQERIKNHGFEALGPPSNMELFSQREAVNGKYVPTKKVNKLSNYYMEIVMAKKNLEKEAKTLSTINQTFKQSGAQVPKQVLMQQVLNATEIHELAARHQSLQSYRRSTDETRLPADAVAESINYQEKSPGPGQYLDIYDKSDFKQKRNSKAAFDKMPQKKQEFGSLQPRFDGPEEQARYNSQHLGPGYYNTEEVNTHNNRLRLQLREISTISPQKPNIGFGKKPQKDERFAYIKFSQGDKMKAPGSYTYKDNLREKKSHNKSQKNTFISEEPRFFQALDHTIKGKDGPGPGTYIDINDGSLNAQQGVLLIQNHNLSPEPFSHKPSIISSHASLSPQKNKNIDFNPPAAQSQVQSQTVLVKKDIQQIIQNSQKMRQLNNSTILQTKRGKNNPDHMFVRPRITRDPAKLNLERVFTEQHVNQAKVPPGTYEMQNVYAIGDHVKEEQYLKKLKSQMGSNYSMMKNEDKNKKWIMKARKDYMAQIEKNKEKKETLKEYLEAAGFETDDLDLQ